MLWYRKAKKERNLKINPRLEEVFLSISSEMSQEEIEKRSMIQHRGRFSILNRSEVLTTNEEEDTFPSKSATGTETVSIPKSTRNTVNIFPDGNPDARSKRQLSFLEFL